MTYARLSAVYGLSWSDINVMPLSAINAYLERISAVLAEQKLVYGEAAMAPHTKNPRETLKRWVEEAYGENIQKTIATPGMLKLIGIGVVHGS